MTLGDHTLLKQAEAQPADCKNARPGFGVSKRGAALWLQAVASSPWDLAHGTWQHPGGRRGFLLSAGPRTTLLFQPPRPRCHGVRRAEPAGRRGVCGHGGGVHAVTRSGSDNEPSSELCCDASDLEPALPWLGTLTCLVRVRASLLASLGYCKACKLLVFFCLRAHCPCYCCSERCRRCEHQFVYLCSVL